MNVDTADLGNLAAEVAALTSQVAKLVALEQERQNRIAELLGTSGEAAGRARPRTRPRTRRRHLQLIPGGHAGATETMHRRTS